VLPANSFIEYKGAICATTPANGIYCNGHSYSNQFLVQPDGSWLGRSDT
jgi:hypothetical protein